MPRRMVMDTSSISASTASASGAPSSLINRPASPGPATSAPEDASVLGMRLDETARGTICVSTICPHCRRGVDDADDTKPTT